MISIDLPACKSAKGVELDLTERHLILDSPTHGPYRLELALPYPIFEDKSNAKFDKSKARLVVTACVQPLPKPAPVVVAAVPVAEESGDAASAEHPPRQPPPQTPPQEDTPAETADASAGPVLGAPLVHQTDDAVVAVVPIAGAVVPDNALEFTERAFGPLVAHDCALVLEVPAAPGAVQVLNVRFVWGGGDTQTQTHTHRHSLRLTPSWLSTLQQFRWRFGHQGVLCGCQR